MKKTIDAEMHTAEHILNGTMDRIFRCGRCVGAHIERKKSKCDYLFDRDLTQEEIQKIQEEVNGVIEKDMDVSEDFITREEAASLFDMSRVPEGSDPIRIIKIGEYDSCPCIGPHVKQTSSLGGFRITTTGHEGDRLRIRFKLSRPGA